MLRILIPLLLVLPVHAQTVYKTVEDGVVSFSDEPPPDGPVETVTIDAPPPSEAVDLDERLQQLRETTELMAEGNRAREEARAEQRAERLAAREESVTPVETPMNVWGSGVWSGYGSGYGYRPRPPHVRPPHHPGHGPGPRPEPLPSPPPGWSVIQPGNAQLMRPVVSGRN